ncbi:g8589 [Coccomyxa viridis]|uniref:G8589 protein n=1 Tax=Coccomyxa viridis TaxID=1274662 RepID=A0ABP1G0Q8_9CHLO
MTWLEQQPSSEQESKSELTEEASERSSSCGSIESPYARSRVLQMARSDDSDGTSSARHWREDERRLASTERRRRSLHGQKSRFCPSSLERPSTCREESLQERQRESRWEIPSDSSLFSIQGPIRAKED